MPQLNQGMTGQLRSIPKLTRINGDDNARVIWRNMGNNHAYPFVWGTSHTISGTEVTIASGVKFHGLTLADNANVTATPSAAPAGRIYIEKDTVNNVVKIKSTASESNVAVDVMWMLAYEDLDVTGIYCRGNDSPTMPALP